MNEKAGFTTLVGVFGLFVATIYLISYWGAFNFDIFQYAGLTDFVKLAIYPLTLSLIGLGTGVALSSALTPAGVLARLTIPNWPLPPIYRAVQIVAILAVLFIQTVVHAQWRWLATIGMCCAAFSIYTFHPTAQRFIPGHVLRINFLMLVVAIPMFSAMAGSQRAQAVKNGKSPLLVDNSGVAAGLKATPEHPLTYVGFVSDTFVIYETGSGNLILLKQSDSAPLVLKPNPNALKGFHLRDLLY